MEGRRMSEEEGIVLEDVKSWLIRVKAKPAVPSAIVADILDVVPGTTRDEAINYVRGQVALEDYIIDKVHFCHELQRLVNLARAMSR